MKLNVGCGDYLANGWVNIDREPRSPSVIKGQRPSVTEGHHFFALNVLDGLPWPDGSCSHIYAGHVLEHLTYDEELPVALTELRRLLAHDGQLMVVGPDISRATSGGYGAETIHGIWPGAHIPDVPGAMHQWRPTVEAHESALLRAGFAAVEVPIRAVEDEWPVVSRIGWQLAFICVHGIEPNAEEETAA